VNRAAGMACLHFGTDDSVYSLHLQCSFRIRENNEIIVTNTEMTYPSSRVISRPSFSHDSFDWDVQGDNRFDEWVSGLESAFTKDLMVIDAKVNDVGDLIVFMSQNLELEVFVDSSTDECWRLFNNYDNKHHFVMTGRGIIEYGDNE